MTEATFEQVTTDDLIRCFVEGAVSLGYIVEGRDGTVNQFSPEGRKVVAWMQALGAELRKRAPIGKIRALYDHDSRDVRRWAAAQFISVDPDWTEAASGALHENISTVEAMALRTRAQTPPPKRPTLQEMTVDQLVDRFEDACMRRYGTRFLHDPESETGGPDIETQNRIIAETADIVAEIKSRNALERLTPFMENRVTTVRFVAAVHCLAIATDQATAVLKEFDDNKYDKHHMAARTTLDRWRRGTYGTDRW